MIAAASSAFEKIKTALNAQAINDGTYTVDCDNKGSGLFFVENLFLDNLPTLTFTINGKNFEIKPQSYVQQVKSNQNNTCIKK